MNKKWIDFDEALALVKEGTDVFRADGKRLHMDRHGLCGGFYAYTKEAASSWGIRFYTLTTEEVPLTLPEAIQAHMDGLTVELTDSLNLWRAFDGSCSVKAYIAAKCQFRLPPIKKKRTVTIEVEEGAEIKINGEVWGG